jgi:hypothetical protein
MWQQQLKEKEKELALRAKKNILNKSSKYLENLHL